MDENKHLSVNLAGTTTLSIGNYLAECRYRVGKLQKKKEQGWLQECEKIYTEAAEQARKRLCPAKFAKFLYEVGAFFHDNHVIEKASEMYAESTAIYKKLTENHPESFMSHTALSLGSWALTQFELEWYDLAEKGYKDALKLYCKLEEITSLPPSMDSQLGIARNMSNLGYLHKIQCKYELAEYELSESLKIYRFLANTNPNKFLPAVATNLYDLGRVYMDIFQYNKAEECLSETLEIDRMLEERILDAHISKVAMDVYNVAFVRYYMGRFDRAEQEFNEAIDIFRQLHEQYPIQYLGGLCDTLNMSALCRLRQGDTGQALAIINEVLELMPDGANYNDTKGEILLAMDDTQGALELWKLALELDPEILEKTHSVLYDELSKKGLV